jgi:hypothetical protein
MVAFRSAKETRDATFAERKATLISRTMLERRLPIRLAAISSRVATLFKLTNT